MTYVFSQIVTKIFDVLVLPFGDNRVVALSAVSLLTGAVLIFVFKAVSDQRRIKETRDKFKAYILEMRIYQDNIVLIHKALFKALGTNLTYLRVSLVPILAMVAVVFVVFVQLDERYGRRHLEGTDRALLTVSLKDGLDPMTVPFELSGGDGLIVDSPPVRSTVQGRIYWRIRTSEPGTHRLTVTVYDKTYSFPVRAEISNGPIGHLRTDGSVFNPLLFPALPRLPKDFPVKAVELRYPKADYPLLVWRTHWLVVFVFFSLVGALIPKLLFGIQV
jgi:hypothetical protein